MLRDKMEAQNAHLEFGLEARRYGVVTLHRPSNVDDPDTLQRICGILERVSERVPLVFPVHPRTRLQMEQGGLLKQFGASKRIVFPDPINYIRFMSLVMNSLLVITDSGGIQEETTHLGIPCLTVRENTERPITITHGTNQLCGLENLAAKAEEVAAGRVPRRAPIELWDGRTADRIVALLRQTLAADAGRFPEPVAHAL
jgi:UDP-N-acetylglucosamine 2-epimerase (non-hydrolysing)